MKKIMLLVLIMFMTLPLVSAADWDNILAYSENDLKVTLRNSILWIIPTSDIGTAELKSHLSIDYIKKVGAGNQVVMWYDFNFLELYENGLGEVTFTDTKTGEEIDRDYSFVYWGEKERDIYGEGKCSYNINGTQTCETIVMRKETYYDWLPYNSKDIPKGNIRIGLKTYVEIEDEVDGVWIITGRKISRHAAWIASLDVGLKYYYAFEEGAGNFKSGDGLTQNDLIVQGSLVRTTGKIGQGVEFDDNNANWLLSASNVDITGAQDRTICWYAEQDSTANNEAFFQWGDTSPTSQFWVLFYDNSNELQAQMNGINFYTEVATTTNMDFHCFITNGTDWEWWRNGENIGNETTALINTANSKIYFGNNIGGTYPFDGIMDELGIWNRTLTGEEAIYLWNGGAGMTFGVGITAPVIVLNSPIDYYNSTSASIVFNGTVLDNINLMNVSLYIDSVLNETNSSGINNTNYIFTKTLSDGSYNWTYFAEDNETANTTATTRYLTVDTRNPSLNLTLLFGLIDFGIGTTNETLNWTVTDDNLDSCWYNYDSTNVSVTCTDNTTTFTLTSQRNLTFYANDSFGHLASNFTTWDYKVFQNYHIYNNETYEMESEIFSINISSNGSEIMLGSLVYNGTSYLATKVGTNFMMEFNKTLTLSQVGQNVSFYWSFNYGGDIINTSTYTQNVSEIVMGFCAGPLTTPTLNFSAYNEEDLSRLLSYDFFATFEYWTGDGSVTKNFSISNASINEVVICININNTFYSDAKIQYEKDGFVKRSHYLINDSLTNSSQDKELFLLNTSSSTSFIIEVKDEVQFPEEDVYVHIQRYYPGTNQYKTVEMALTDGTGSTIGHFEAETEDYRVIFEKEGVIIFQSGTQKIFCRETPCTLSFQTTAGAGITWDEFGIIDLFSWTLDYTEGTEIWTLTYTDTSGSIGYGRLYVYYETPVAGKITICNTTSSQLADTITCDVTGYNGTIYAAAYLSRSPEILVYLKSIIISALKTIFAFEGLFLMMFVLLLLGLAGLWNPAVGIILTIGGILIFNIMGISTFGAVTIWGLILIGLIILWELKT